MPWPGCGYSPNCPLAYLPLPLHLPSTFSNLLHSSIFSTAVAVWPCLGRRSSPPVVQPRAEENTPYPFATVGRCRRPICSQPVPSFDQLLRFFYPPTCSAVVPFLPSEIAVLLLLLFFSAVSLLVWASSCSSFSFRLPVYPLRWQLPKALRAPLSHYGRPLSSPPVPLKPQPPRG